MIGLKIAKAFYSKTSITEELMHKTPTRPRWRIKGEIVIVFASISQQYFSLTPNQHQPPDSQQCFFLTTNQHQSPVIDR